MSVTFESPTRYLSDTENSSNLMFSLGSNENEGSPLRTSPFNSGNQQHVQQQHQEFFNALQRRQNSVQFSTGLIYRHEDYSAPIESAKLDELMTKFDCHKVLVIDVRSFAFYSKNRIKSAIHISIPSVLLKRPNYTLEKVCDTIVSQEAADRLKNWHHATQVVFYDHESYKHGNWVTAILISAKLRKSGYNGQLNYLQGGFNTFSKAFPHQCELVSLDSIHHQTKRHQPKTICLLPTSAQTLATANPFFSNIRQNLELSHGPLEERFAVRLPYGSINDNGLISACSQHTAINNNHHPRFGLAGSSVDQQGNFILPLWLAQVMKTDTGPEKLADKYEKLERLEQERLAAVMKYHSNRLDVLTTTSVSKQQDQSKSDFPFSITSSMEKGTLNRYDNIWPYEYSRVKLQENDDDYINANHVHFADIQKNITLRSISKSNQQIKLQEKGLLSEASVRTMNQWNSTDLTVNRRYISTQGPLPTTFDDFWQMIWNEGSSVIVMLTQETEMNKIKCHKYWPTVEDATKTYGSISVTITSESKQAVHNMNDKRERVSDDLNEGECIITRKFALTRGGVQRSLTQLQYIGWTDFGVPDHPIGILTLVHCADFAQSKKKDAGPLVVHCSAGCGRSGTFCVIDTMIQRLWQKRDVYTCTTDDKIWETVSRFREQRMSMVQTHRQFVFCYEAILWWLLGYGNLPVQSEAEAESKDDPPLTGPTSGTMMRDMLAMPTRSIISPRLSASPPSLPRTATFLPPTSLFSTPVETSHCLADKEEVSSLSSIVDNFKEL